MTERDTTEVTHVSRDLALGRWKNVCFTVWRAKPTVASAQVMEQQYVVLGREYPRGFLSIGVIEANVPNPERPAGKAISAAMDAVEKELLGTAVVLEATGFGAAALRAALATMSMLTRSRFPRRFFSSADDAFEWAARLVPDLGGAHVLAARFAEFRTQT